MPVANHVYHKYLEPLSSGYLVNGHNIEPRMVCHPGVYLPLIPKHRSTCSNSLTQVQISTVLLYHELYGLAKLVRYTPAPPVLPPEFFQSLIAHLMQGVRYDEARRVATQGHI